MNHDFQDILFYICANLRTYRLIPKSRDANYVLNVILIVLSFDL